MTCSQIGTYDQVKHGLLKANLGFEDGFVTHATASFTAGIVVTTASTPVDVVKTRIMNDSKGLYKGSADCAGAIMRQEGPLAFMKGWVPCWARLGTHTTLFLVLLEQLRAAAGLGTL